MLSAQLHHMTNACLLYLHHLHGYNTQSTCISSLQVRVVSIQGHGEFTIISYPSPLKAARESVLKQRHFANYFLF